MPIAQPIEEEDNNCIPTTPAPTSQKKGHSALYVSFAIASLLCATLLYFYKDATTKREMEEYQIALNSKDPLLLQSFIDTYRDVNREHAETIRQQLETIQEETAKQQKTKAEEEDRQQSLDIGNTEEQIEKPQAKDELSQEERQHAFNAVRRFFVAINKNSRESLKETVTASLTSLNGKSGATKTDVVQYMADLYQADVKNLNWHLGSPATITKRNAAEGNTLYRVEIPAKEVIERESTTAEVNYRVTATVNDEGKIVAIDIDRQ